MGRGGDWQCKDQTGYNDKARITAGLRGMDDSYTQADQQPWAFPDSVYVTES